MDQSAPSHPSRRPKRRPAVLMMVIGAVVTVLSGGLLATFLVIFAGQQAEKAMPLGQFAASAGVVVLGIVLVLLLAGGQGKKPHGRIGSGPERTLCAGGTAGADGRRL